MSNHPGFPDELFERLVALDVGAQGQRIVELSTGAAWLARGFAKRGAEAVAVVSTDELLEKARGFDDELGVRLEYVTSAPERTSLDSGSFDVVTVGQAWLWIDRTKTIREVKRLLKPSGRLVLANFDWLPLKENAVAATEALIEKYNPEWRMRGGTGVHPQMLTEVRHAGFHDVETFSFDINVSYSHERWRNRVRINAGVKANLAKDERFRLDEKLRQTLAEKFPQEPLIIPHCVWVLVGRAP